MPISDEIQVSPRFYLDKKSNRIRSLFKDKETFKFDDPYVARLIFKDRMQGWFFEPAYQLVELDHTIAAIHIVTPLIEALEMYRMARGKPSELFINSASRIFEHLDESALKTLYHGVRCGFAHQGFLNDPRREGYDIVISSQPQADDKSISVQDTRMIIYCQPYISTIESAFKKYYSLLEEDEDLQCKFMRVWQKHWNMKKPHLFGIS